MPDPLRELSATRQFHQTMMVSLIEACKGIRELFTDNKHASSDATADVDQEPKGAYQHLKAMITATMKEYENVLLQAFRRFFDKYQRVNCNIPVDFDHAGFSDDVLAEELRSFRARLGDADPIQQSGAADQPEPETNAFALLEERSSWILLARQSIMDVLYLDSAQKEVAVLTHANAGEASSPDFHSHSFSNAILSELQRHNAFLISHGIRSYTKHVQSYLPRVASIASMCRQLSGDASSNRPRDSARSLLARGMAHMNDVFELLSSQFLDIFSEAVRLAKPVLDIHEMLRRDSNSLMVDLCADFSQTLCRQLLEDADIITDDATVRGISLRSGDVDEEREIFAVSRFYEVGKGNPSTGGTLRDCIADSSSVFDVDIVACPRRRRRRRRRAQRKPTASSRTPLGRLFAKARRYCVPADGRRV